MAMIDNILKNKKTTIVGAVIFLTGLVLFLLEYIDFTNMMIFMASALTMLFCKDPKGILWKK